MLIVIEGDIAYYIDRSISPETVTSMVAIYNGKNRVSYFDKALLFYGKKYRQNPRMAWKVL